MYKLHSEDPHKYVIEHKDGSTFSVAKSAIDESLHKKIAALPRVQKFADGGEVQDPFDSGQRSEMPAPDSADQIAADAQASPTTPQYNNLVQYYKNQGVSGLGGTPETRANEDLDRMNELSMENPESLSNSDLGTLRGIENIASGQNSQVKPSAAPQAGPAPSSVTDQTETNQAAPSTEFQTPQSPGAPAQQQPVIPGADVFGAQQNALGSLNNATQAYLKNTQSASDAYQKQMNDFNALTQQHAAQALKEADDAKNAYMSGKVDPNRVWHNMSAGNKALATIGILLSGIGSGLTGQKNMALEVLDKTIDRDIEAQKANMGKNYSLYQMNLEKYRNQSAADAATRLQMYNAYQAQLQQQAGKLQSAQSLSNYQLANAQIDLAKKQFAYQIGTTMAKAKAVGALGGEGGTPVNQEDPRLLMDKDYQEHRVIANGRAYQAASKEDASDLRKTEALYKPIVDDISLLKSLGSSAVADPENRKRAQAALNRLAMNVNEFNGYKRFTDTDKETISHMFNDPSAVASLFQGTGATADTLKALQNKMEAERQSKLLGYRGMSQFKTFKPMAQR